MKLLFRNCTEYKRRLAEGGGKFDPRDYPFFCLVLGYLLNKVDDFHLLYKTLEEALQLVVEDKFPEAEYFQWLMFLNENPHRIGECQAFVSNLKSDQTIDVIDEIDTLFNCDQYQKRSLNNQNRTRSVDTVLMNSQTQQVEKQQQYNHFQHQQHQEQKAYEPDFDYEMILKMKEDQQMARRLQQEQEKYMKEYRSKMKEQETMCEICYVDLYDGNPAFLDKCGHGFHQECLIESFKSQISLNNFPLRCPNQNCKDDCLEFDIRSILPEELYKKYQDHTLKAYADMHGDSVSWCPTADCGYMFFYEKGDNVRFECLECKKEYCLNCRCDWHKDMSCAEYKVSTTMSEDDQKFLDFVKGKKFKQCPKCKYWVEKNEGCDHMTCKCKFQFCYKCGGVYMKCECVEKARQQNRRRLAMREESRRKKLQKMEQKKKQAEERALRGEDSKRATRSKRGRKAQK